MDFQTLKSIQGSAIERFNNALRKGKAAHAVIIEGPQGTYALEVARTFAALLLCPNTALESCPHLKRIFNETHPNVVTIAPEKNTIIKEDIKQLQHNFNQTAVEEGPKVYIIDAADTMNTHAANALLKFLEEPHPDIYGFLITEDAHKLLPTIQSRSQIIRLKTLSPKIISSHLIQRGFEEDEARLAAHLNAHMESAEAFIQDPLTIQALAELPQLYQRLNQPTSILTSDASWIANLVKDKAYFERFMAIWSVYHKDIIYVKMGVEEACVWLTDTSLMQAYAAQRSLAVLNEEFAHILNLRDHVHQPYQMELALENLWVTLERR